MTEEMVGYGSSANGGYYFSPHSNLSPLAPPFTVDRSVPKPVSTPLVDLTESSYGVSLTPSHYNWLGPNPPDSGLDFLSIPNSEFDSLVSTGAYGYSSSAAHKVPPSNTLASTSTDAAFNCQSPTSFPEGNVYYATYVSHTRNDKNGSLVVPHHSGYDLSSPFHAPTATGSSIDAYSQSMSHTPQWGGFWEGWADWKQQNQVPFDRSFTPKENFMNQGLYSSDCFSKYEVATHGLDAVDKEKHVECASAGQLDYKSFFGENFNLTSDYPATTSASSSEALVTFPREPSLKAFNSRNHHVLLGALYGESPRKFDSSLNGNIPVTRSSPAVVIRMPEQKHPSSVQNLDDGDVLDAKDFVCNNLSTAKDDHPYTSFGGKGRFDVRQIRFQLEQNEELLSDKGVSKDKFEQLSGAKPGTQVSYASLDGFNLTVNDVDAIYSTENCSTSNNLDLCNPAVDSPCWKGSLPSCKSPFEVSDSMTTQDMKKVEVCNESNLHSPQICAISSNDALNARHEKMGESVVLNDGGISENCLCPGKRPLVVDDVFSAEETPVFKFRASGTPQILDDTNSSDLKSPQTRKQNSEGKYIPEKGYASGNDVGDVRDLNDDSDDCSSHVPFHTIENVLQSPPSSENTCNILNNSHDGESKPKISVRALVDTMHNLSELLLSSCSDDKYELKEDDYGILETVMKNLDMFILKNAERMSSKPESFIPPEANFQSVGKLSRTLKGVNEYGCHATGLNAVTYDNPVNYSHVMSEKEHNTASVKSDETLSNFPARGSSDIVEDDTVTQSIKNALAQDFPGEEETNPQILLFKNLWLEAEAALCSVNCMTRFNRMKYQMEKCKSQKEYDSRIISTRNVADDVMARLQILKDRNCNSNPLNTSAVEKLSSSKVSPDRYMAEEFSCEPKNGPKTDISIQDTCMPIMTSQADNTKTRVLILETHIGNYSSANPAAVEKLSSSRFSADANKVAQLASESKNGTKVDASTQDFHKPIMTNQAGDVVARSYISKGQIENSNAVNASEVGGSSISKCCSELSNVDKMACEAKDSAKKNIFNQDVSVRSIPSQPDDVTARFNILKSRGGNSNSGNTSCVEKLSSYKVCPNLINAHELEQSHADEFKAKDGAKQDISIQESPMSSECSPADDVESSVMARYRILKHRVDSSSSMYMKKKQECGDLEYAGLRGSWPVKEDELGDGNTFLDGSVKPLLQKYASSSDEDVSTVKECHQFVNYEPIARSRMVDWFEVHSRPGGFDSSSSDWEHVLKEELTGQNS